MNENNEEFTAELDELLARVFQHESDHLEGKLILDYVGDEERKKLIEQFKEALANPKEPKE